MIMPPVLGTCTQTDFFVYAACDSVYFNEFGQEFINSIKQNTQLGIHIHLFNPQVEQIDYCHAHGVTVTWELAPIELFTDASKTKLDTTQFDRTTNAMRKGGDKTLLERIQKTYYACARFIRLQELFTNSISVLELDIDAVVRKTIPILSADCDFHIHHIAGKKARYLAGGLWLNAGTNANQFLTEYAQQLTSYLDKNYIYWGLDQDLLDPIVPKFVHQQLPISLIDWNMHPDSAVWTAKGARKNLSVFVNEKRKYKF